MAVDRRIEEAALRAEENVPKVIRRFIKAKGINQRILGDAVGLDQQEVSYRLNHPSALDYVYLARIAAFFNVPIDTLYKEEDDALADLFSGSRAKGAYLSPAA